MTIEYRDIYQLMHHLQGMGENNALIERRPFIARKTLQEADRLYKVGLGKVCECRNYILLPMEELMPRLKSPCFRDGQFARKRKRNSDNRVDLRCHYRNFLTLFLMSLRIRLVKNQRIDLFVLHYFNCT